MLNILAKSYPNVLESFLKPGQKLHRLSLITLYYTFAYPYFIYCIYLPLPFMYNNMNFETCACDRQGFLGEGASATWVIRHRNIKNQLVYHESCI